MTYRLGDYACPADLPKRFVCRVTGVERIEVGPEACQILKLEPLEGPWPKGTSLVRLSDYVVNARVRELWRTGSGIQPLRRDVEKLSRARRTTDQQAAG
jgi:hypothetical protein